MKSKFLVLMLLAGGSAFAESHWSFSVGVGAPVYYPPPAARVIVERPPCPGPDYEWIDGYWSPYGERYNWTAGYWTRRPYEGAYWIAPRYENHRYYNGYWGRGYYRNEYRRDWDRDRHRDWERRRDWDRRRWRDDDDDRHDRHDHRRD
jgi:hypothetical protein